MIKSGTEVRFSNQKCTGVIVMSNPDSAFVNFNDGDSCWVDSSKLSEVTV